MPGTMPMQPGYAQPMMYPQQMQPQQMQPQPMRGYMPGQYPGQYAPSLFLSPTLSLALSLSLSKSPFLAIDALHFLTCRFFCYTSPFFDRMYNVMGQPACYPQQTPLPPGALSFLSYFLPGN